VDPNYLLTISTTDTNASERGPHPAWRLLFGIGNPAAWLGARRRLHHRREAVAKGWFKLLTSMIPGNEHVKSASIERRRGETAGWQARFDGAG
jgi:hypothetical protein